MKPVFTCLVLLLLTFSFSVKAGNIKLRVEKTDTVCGKIYAVKKLSPYKYILLIKDSLNNICRVVYQNVKKTPVYLHISRKSIGKKAQIVGKLITGNDGKYLYVTDPQKIMIMNFMIKPYDDLIKLPEDESILPDSIP